MRPTPSGPSTDYSKYVSYERFAASTMPRTCSSWSASCCHCIDYHLGAEALDGAVEYSSSTLNVVVVLGFETKRSTRINVVLTRILTKYMYCTTAVRSAIHRIWEYEKKKKKQHVGNSLMANAVQG